MSTLQRPNRSHGKKNNLNITKKRKRSPVLTSSSSSKSKKKIKKDEMDELLPKQQKTMSTRQRPITRSYAKKNNLNNTTFLVDTKKRKRSHVSDNQEFEMDRERLRNERLLELLSKQQKTISEDKEFDLLARFEKLKQPIGKEITVEEIIEKYNHLIEYENPETELNAIQTLKKSEMLVEFVNNSEQLLNRCNENFELIINHMEQNRADTREKFTELNELIRNLQAEIKKDNKIIIKNQENELRETLNNKSIEQLQADKTQFSSLMKSGVKNIAKMIILSPFKITNIIVFKPAGYFFSKVFGDPSYIIWGGLMFILCILCLISIYINLRHYNPTILNHIINVLNIFNTIISSIFGESAKGILYLFGGTITIIKEYLLNGYEYGKKEFFVKVNEILFGIKDYLIPKFSLWDDGKDVSKVNNFYKIIVNKNSKKIKLVNFKTNSLKSIKRSSKKKKFKN